MINHMTLKGRTFERTQGCWNCLRWENQELARKRWQDCERAELAAAEAIRLVDPRGEAAPKYLQIRKTVAQGRQMVFSGRFGVCLAGGVETDFVEAAHLCEKWSAKTGASIARAGAAPDPLPDELKDKVGD
jgi:hypothetical protein